MIDWLQLNFVALLNVIVIDVVLAGDNAIIVGLAASRVAPELRSRVIFWGMVGAVVLRIAFAGVTHERIKIFFGQPSCRSRQVFRPRVATDRRYRRRMACLCCVWQNSHGRLPGDPATVAVGGPRLVTFGQQVVR